MDLTIKKSKYKSQIKDDFSADENESLDICGFSDGEAKIDGTLLKTFTFDSTDEPVEVSITPPSSSNTNAADININKDSINSINKKNALNLDHRTLKANPNGRTPAVDGEIYDMVRTYTLRRSTVRILSKIKAIHSDDNVYLNTIVDEAIRYYYEYLKSNNE